MRVCRTWDFHSFQAKRHRCGQRTAAVAGWMTVFSASSRVADTGNTRTQENDILCSLSSLSVFNVDALLLYSYIWDTKPLQCVLA